MNILVMGGNRFFGARLVQNLLKDGHQVTLLNRGKHADAFKDSVRRIKLDRKKIHANTPELKDTHWDLVYDQICYDAPEAEAACATFENKVGRYIFTSSESVYPHGQYWEESSFDPLKYKFTEIAQKDLDYAESKRQAEATFFQKAKFPVTAVRFPIVVGVDDYTQRLKFHVTSVMKGTPIYFPNIDAKLALLSSSEAGRFLTFLANHDIEGPINCCAPEPIRLREIMQVIEGITRKTAVYADKAAPGNESQYGIPNDWTMKTEKLKSHGFAVAPWQNWLPQIIEMMAHFE